MQNDCHARRSASRPAGGRDCKNKDALPHPIDIGSPARAVALSRLLMQRACTEAYQDLMTILPRPGANFAGIRTESPRGHAERKRWGSALSGGSEPAAISAMTSPAVVSCIRRDDSGSLAGQTCHRGTRSVQLGKRHPGENGRRRGRTRSREIALAAVFTVLVW